MQRQQVKNVVSSTRKPATVSTAKSKPVPLDREALKQVVGGAAPNEMPNKGW